MPTTLQDELGKADPFESPLEEAYLSLVRTASVLSGSFAALFREHGLSESTYNVLRILRGAGPDGRHATDIRKQMVVRVPDVTRLVDRLEKMGLGTRERCGEDRRIVHVKITRRGSDLLDRLDVPIRDLHRELLGQLSDRKLSDLIKLLQESRDPHLDL